MRGEEGAEGRDGPREHSKRKNGGGKCTFFSLAQSPFGDAQHNNARFPPHPRPHRSREVDLIIVLQLLRPNQLPELEPRHTRRTQAPLQFNSAGTICRPEAAPHRRPQPPQW
jgi:hypothetical protein